MFCELELKMSNSITKERLAEVEKSIEERVHLKKFNVLETRIEGYMKEKDFYDYKEKMDIEIAYIHQM